MYLVRSYDSCCGLSNCFIFLCVLEREKKKRKREKEKKKNVIICTRGEKNDSRSSPRAARDAAAEPLSAHFGN